MTRRLLDLDDTMGRPVPAPPESQEPAPPVQESFGKPGSTYWPGLESIYTDAAALMRFIDSLRLAPHTSGQLTKIDMARRMGDLHGSIDFTRSTNGISANAIKSHRGRRHDLLLAEGIVPLRANDALYVSAQVRADELYTRVARQIPTQVLSLDTRFFTDWIDWPGGPCPIPVGCGGQLTFRNGHSRNMWGSRDWAHTADPDMNIVQFRMSGFVSVLHEGVIHHMGPRMPHTPSDPCPIPLDTYYRVDTGSGLGPIHEPNTANMYIWEGRHVVGYQLPIMWYQTEAVT